MSDVVARRSGNAIVHRWVIINAVLTAVISVGAFYGILDRFLVDDTYITHVIGVTFILFTLNTLFMAFKFRSDWKRLRKLNLEYQTAKANGTETEFRERLYEHLSRRLLLTETAGPVLVAMGLLGTVVGISLAFSGLGVDIIGNTQASQDAIAILLGGMATAFHTTLVGIAGMLWNMANLHILRHEASRLYSSILKA